MICPKFYFSTLYDSHVFPCEFNKGLECSKSLIETIYHLLIWAMKEPSIYYLCLLSSFLFFSMPCNFYPWCPWWNFHHAHCLYHYSLPRSPFQVFNLARSLGPNFCLGRHFFSYVISLESIHVDWVKHLFPIQICNSCSTS